MSTRLRRKYRRIAWAFTLIMVFDIAIPTISYALTGGPSQPEFEAFEPVTTDQMVDLFTGDFTYNIPLMTVPGPNGGYPINLAYQSEIGMEQEASWVGLGWNVNVGQITRQMRGLPDDFNGDMVTREFNMKKSRSLSLSYAHDRRERKGVNTSLPNEQYQVNLNNYTGVSLSYGRSLIPNNPLPKESRSKYEVEGFVSLDLAIDSKKGLEIQPTAGLAGAGKRSQFRTYISPKFTSLNGLETMDMNGKYTNSFKVGNSHKYSFIADWAKMGGTKEFSSSAGAGISFSSPSYVPGSFAPFKGTTANLNFAFGPFDGVNWTQSSSIGGTYSDQRIHPDYESREYPAYGYLNTEFAAANGERLMDFNRENDVPVTRRSQVAPMPVYTHDQFIIKGQGVGGAFRPYRSDVGILSQESFTGTTRGGTAGIELTTGTTPPVHVGVSPSYSQSESYQGNWQGGLGAITDASGVDLRSTGKTTADPLHEPVYFKMNGEMTASDPSRYDNIRGQQAGRFKLGLDGNTGSGIFGKAPKVLNLFGANPSSSLTSSANQIPERELRNTNIQWRTMGQIDLDQNTAQSFLYKHPNPSQGITEFPIAANESTTVDPFSGRPQHHIGEITVLNDQGERYVYGLPAYINDHKDVSYAVEGITPTGITDNTIDYPQNAGDVSSIPDNTNGSDHWYSNVQLPAYVHSHLLTAVFSPDYVDVTDDGPSDDDLGYYVKFNYYEPDQYNWRSPWNGSFYDNGHASNDQDDRASYSFGSREQYYLHSVETKTHVAVFALDNREDAIGAEDEDNYSFNPASCTKSQVLTSIALYSKNDLTTPLKTVELDHNYTLCPGVPNRTSVSFPDNGKLTLEEVRIIHLNSERGSLNPYRFTYHDMDGVQNGLQPEYSEANMDRWGNYAEPSSAWEMNENPYVDQDLLTTTKADRDGWASAWRLSTIQLPSGGTIEVEYEQDDYAYVQNKPAGQMCKIIGTQDIDDDPIADDILDASDDAKLKAGHLRIFFELDTLTTTAEFDYYVRSLSQVYFKTWQYLKDYPGNSVPADDYVSGYAEIEDDPNNKGAVAPSLHGLRSSTIGYITVKAAEYGPASFPVHPFRKAGWQYIRYERPDLMDDQLNSGLLPAIGQVLSTVATAVPRLLGWYQYADFRGFSNILQNPADPTTPPSYLRLNSPDGIKYGGGSRVASVKLSDHWIEGVQEYGKQYTYRTTDADGRRISSGVAAYEPMIGGDEISLRQPIWYDGNDQRIKFQHRDAYVEEPLGESYYPGASVGYSRIVVTDLRDADYVSSMNGTTVHEFYTAKDFPVQIKRTDINTARYNPPDLFIPFVGMTSTNNHGYSMGYAVHLNDMHGKPKSVATYAFGQQNTQEPATRTTYKYHEDANHPSGLGSKVNVLYDHFDVQQAVVGQTMDFFVEAREHSTAGESYGVNVNVEVPPIPFWLMLEPQLVQNRSMFRSIVTNKVIQTNGILKEVVNEVDGARSVSRNELFDAYSGQPLLTTVDNSWDDPVYTYKYAAHMAYDGMGNASKNWGAESAVSNVNPGEYLVTGVATADEVFHPGDEVVDALGYHFWVTSTTGPNVFLEKADGLPAVVQSPVSIHRSGYRNQQKITNGSIVSLDDPTSWASCYFFSFIDYFNEHVFQNQAYNNMPNIPAIPVPDCENGSTNSTSMDQTTIGSTAIPVADQYCCGGFINPSNWFDFFGWSVTGLPGCEYSLMLEDAARPAPASIPNLNEIRIVNVNGPIHAFAQGGYSVIDITVEIGGNLYQAYWTEFDNQLHNDCIFPVRILHADITEYNQAWDYDYIDVQLTPLTGSDYKDGRQGIWRPKRNFLYQINRLNYEAIRSNTRSDGEYDLFHFFDFDDSNQNGSEWVVREEMNRYSPYGFALESENSIGIKSSELYGHDNSLVTAVAGNAGYYELAYEGFEDLGNTYSPTSGNGHLELIGGSTSLSNNAHTGSHSLIIPYGGAVTYSGNNAAGNENWTPEANKRYVVSAWFKTSTRAETPEIVLSGVATIDNVIDDQVPIEGWRKVDIEFTTAATPGAFSLQFQVNGQTADAYLDDIRIHPAEGSCVTHCYDPDLYWLKATLDDRNYATFYNYDEQGVLTQVKQETENGIVTLKSTRQFTAETTPQ